VFLRISDYFLLSGFGFRVTLQRDVKEYNPADYQAHNETANNSVNDICVKAQKLLRPMPEGQEKKSVLTIQSLISRTKMGHMSLMVMDLPSYSHMRQSERRYR
jgi:hypothetical protein